MAENDYATRKELFAKHSNGPYVQFLKRMGLDLDAKSAAGAVVFDASGKRYIDCIAGYGNCVLGHNHPAVTDAVVDELRSPRKCPEVDPSEAGQNGQGKLGSGAR